MFSLPLSSAKEEAEEEEGTISRPSSPKEEGGDTEAPKADVPGEEPAASKSRSRKPFSANITGRGKGKGRVGERNRQENSHTHS